MKIKQIASIAATALFAVSSFAQILTSPVNVTNGAQAAPIQLNFAPIAVSEFISVQPHAALVGNVTTNETITLLYGRQPSSASGTNLNQFATLTTNFTAGWCFTNFGYTTNNFSVVIPTPQVQTTVLDGLWGTFSNSLGSNSVTFY